MAGSFYRLLELPGGEWTKVGERFPCDIVGARARTSVPISLQSDLERELSEALPEFGLPGYFQAKPGWLVDGPYTALAVERATGRAAALASGGWREGPVCPPFFQIATMLIARPHRGGVLLPTLLRILFEMVLGDDARGFPTLVALRTCNARAFRAMAVFDRLEGFLFYPRIDGGPQDPLMREMAVRVAHVLSPQCGFDPEIGRIRDSAVPPDFYQELPDGGPDEVRSYIQRHLSVRDRILCLGLVTTQKARRAILSALRVNLGPSEKR